MYAPGYKATQKAGGEEALLCHVNYYKFSGSTLVSDYLLGDDNLHGGTIFVTSVMNARNAWNPKNV